MVYLSSACKYTIVEKLSAYRITMSKMGKTEFKCSTRKELVNSHNYNFTVALAVITICLQQIHGYKTYKVSLFLSLI